MDILTIKSTENTPGIILDKQNGIFEISGRSLPEDASHIYNPVLEWLKTYSAAPNPTTEFALKFEYLNTASSKLILDIFSTLGTIKGSKILWYFHDDDEDMEEVGEELAELTDIPFEFKTY